MKVCLVSHSDIRGGASIAALRLLNALRKAGIEARMIVKSAEGESRDDIQAIGGGLKDKIFFLAERLHIFASNGFDRSQLFKVSTAECGLSLHNHPWILDADIVVLNWFNQGMMALSEIKRIKKPVVWVMHDMWPLTGICHYSFGCERYEQRCGCCPFLGRRAAKHDLSYKVLKKKAEIYSQKPVEFVAVSRWLADRAKKSTLLRDKPVTVINNTFPANEYSVVPQKSRAELGLPDESKRLIVLCSARIDAPVKDFPAAVGALNGLDGRGVDDVALVLCGEIRDRSLLDGLKIPYCEMGNVSDPLLLREIYSHSSVLLSTAKYETFGLTLMEAMASGAVPVAVGSDGREDIIDHKSNGYLAGSNDIDDLTEGIVWALESGLERESQRQAVIEKFSEEVIAEKYISLFNKILEK